MSAAAAAAAAAASYEPPRRGRVLPTDSDKHGTSRFVVGRSVAAAEPSMALPMRPQPGGFTFLALAAAVCLLVGLRAYESVETTRGGGSGNRWSISSSAVGASNARAAAATNTAAKRGGGERGGRRIGGGGGRGGINKNNKMAAHMNDEYYDDDDFTTGEDDETTTPFVPLSEGLQETEKDRLRRGEARAPPIKGKRGGGDKLHTAGGGGGRAADGSGKSQRKKAAEIEIEEEEEEEEETVDSKVEKTQVGAAALETTPSTKGNNEEPTLGTTADTAAKAPALAPQPPSPPRHLSKRPPRTPPDWLLAGECEPPIGWEAEAKPFRTASSYGAFLEEQHGETLLGDCKCPLKSGIESDFDCGAYDWRILSDLAPWHGVNISSAAMDMTFDLQTANIPPGYHFSINKGRVLMRMRAPTSAYHNQILDMLRTVVTLVDLPDVEFILHAWDHAKVWRQDPIPVFSFIRDAAKNDITVPYPYRWEGSGMSVAQAGDCPAWEARASKVMWRGGCTGPTMGYRDEVWDAYIRYRATVLTAKRPDILDAGLADQCSKVGIKPLAPVDTVFGSCQHKHLLLLDGNTASGRSSLWVHQGSVLLKPDSVFSEWYYHLMRPWVHYVPVREFLEDGEEQAQWVVKDAPPKALQCLRDNLAKLAKTHVNTNAIACYWWRLLTEWKRHQPQESRTEGFQQI